MSGDESGFKALKVGAGVTTYTLVGVVDSVLRFENCRWALMFNDGSVEEACCHRAQLILIYKLGRQKRSK